MEKFNIEISVIISAPDIEAETLEEATQIVEEDIKTRFVSTWSVLVNE